MLMTVGRDRVVNDDDDDADGADTISIVSPPRARAPILSTYLELGRFHDHPVIVSLERLETSLQ